MNYLEYWKFQKAPFVNGSNDGPYFEGVSVREASARLCFMIESGRRTGILIGGSQSGKTSFLRYAQRSFQSWVPQSAIRSVRLSLRGLTEKQLVLEILTKLAGTWPSVSPKRVQDSVSDQLQVLSDYILSERSQDRRLLLLLDDTSFAKPEVIHIVSNLIYSELPLTMLLVADEGRIDKLDAGLVERCQLRIELAAWDLGQTADYFDWMLATCGGRGGIFEAAAITRIHELADARPFRMNELAELSLIAGALRRAARVTSEIVDQVYEEQRITPDVSNMRWGEPSREVLYR